jgi:hypothetical protein
MTKITNSICPTRTRFRKLSVAVTASICAAVLFATIVTVLMLSHGSLPVVRADSATSAERKLQQAEHAAAPDSRTVSLTEDEVNSVLHDRLRKNGRLATADVDGLHDLRVRLIGDQMKVFIVIGRRGTDITVELEGKLYSTERQLQFVPVSGAIGSLRLPKAILASAMQQALNAPGERQKLQLPPDIADLRVENSQVLLRYN